MDPIGRAIEAGARASCPHWQPCPTRDACSVCAVPARAAIAAFLRSLASEPTPEMVDASRVACLGRRARFQTLRTTREKHRARLSAALIEAAEQVEETTDAG